MKPLAQYATFELCSMTNTVEIVYDMPLCARRSVGDDLSDMRGSKTQEPAIADLNGTRPI